MLAKHQTTQLTLVTNFVKLYATTYSVHLDAHILSPPIRRSQRGGVTLWSYY